MKPGLRYAIYLGLVIAVGPTLAMAGALEPPGPPGPTFKSLTDVEPRQIIRANTEVIEAITIDQPGSYYLAENITAIPDNNAITITASHVNLDLNGFIVSGNLEVNDGNGIYISGDNVTVSNGTVQFTDGDGIRCESASFTTLINVNSLNNGGFGVLCSEMDILNGNFSKNGSSGVSGSWVVIDGARASENKGHGFSIAGGNLSRGFSLGNGLNGINCTPVPTGVLVTQTNSLSNSDVNIDADCVVFDSYAAP